MGAEFGGYSCLAPEYEAANAARANAPTTPWLGKANSFRCPLGPTPGQGWILLLRRDLDAMGLNTPRTLRFGPDPDGRIITLPSLYIVRAAAIVPGERDDPDTAYWVELTDKRRLAKASVIDKAYNVRSSTASATYYSATLNVGVAWTWSEMVSDIWSAVGTSILGTFASLPFTPDGTPEGWDFYGGNAYDALNAVLDRIGCALRYDPLAATFDIVRIGADDDEALSFSEENDTDRTWDSEWLQAMGTLRAKTLRVRFPRRRAASDTTGGSPWYVVDVTDPDPDGTPTGVLDGTYAQIDDDLPAQYDSSGTLTNSAALATRATERATDFFRRARLERKTRTYTGMLEVRPGSKIQAVQWEEKGPGPLGLKTSIVEIDGLPLPIANVMAPDVGYGSSAAVVGSTQDQWDTTTGPCDCYQDTAGGNFPGGTFTGPVSITNQLFLSSQTLALGSGSVTNLAITNQAPIQYLTATGDVSWYSIDASTDNLFYFFFNSSAYNITLVQDDGATGTAAERFDNPGDVSFILLPGQWVMVWYNTTTDRWNPGVFPLPSQWPVADPATITTDQNDYQPGAGVVVTLNVDSAATITGFVARPDGSPLLIVNNGDSTLTLANLSGSSSSANQIITSTGSDLSVPAKSFALLVYDGDAAMWRATTFGGGSGVPATGGTFTGPVVFEDLLTYTPGAASLSSNQNNYALPTSPIVRMDVSGTRDVTGFDSTGIADGTTYYITNVGSGEWVFKNNSGSSSSGNKLFTNTAQDYALKTNQTARVEYSDTLDSSNGGWLVTPLQIGGSAYVDASGKLVTQTTASGSAGFNVPQGTTPSSPANGDVWSTSTAYYAYINSATQATVPINSDGTYIPPASSTTRAGLNLPHGTAPTSPNNGDVWTTTTAMYVQINGSTVQLGAGGGSPGGADTYVQFNDGGSFGGETQFAYNKTTHRLTVQDAAVSEEFILAGGLSAATLTGSVNDYSPGSLDSAVVLNVSADAAGYSITGIDATGLPSGKLLWIRNVGVYSITLPHNSGLSASGNIFANPDSKDMILVPNAAFLYWRDSIWTCLFSDAGFSSFGRTLVDDADASAARTTLGLGTLATQSGTFSGTSSGTNTGDQTPGGSDTHVQFNDSGSFGGEAAFAYDKTTNQLTVPGLTLTEDLLMSAIYDSGSSNLDDYNPTGLATANTILYTAGAAINLTGIAGGATGRILVFFNLSPYTITVKSMSGSSTFGNQFLPPDVSDYSLPRMTGMIIRWDSDYWQIIAGSGGSSGGSVAASSVSITDSGAYYTGTDVEAALQEIGADLASVSGGSIHYSAVSGFRLTLTSATPVTTSDVTAAGTLYMAVYTADHLLIPNTGATDFDVSAPGQLSLSLTLTSGKNYDVFCWNNSGTPTLALSSAWTDDTTRADALGTLKGVKVNDATISSMGAKRGVWLGIIRASGSNTTEDSKANRYVVNAYNRVDKSCQSTDATLCSTTSVTPVQVGSVQISFLSIGDRWIHIRGISSGFPSTAAKYGIMSIGSGATTDHTDSINAMGGGAAGVYSRTHCTVDEIPSAGLVTRYLLFRSWNSGFTYNVDGVPYDNAGTSGGKTGTILEADIPC